MSWKLQTDVRRSALGGAVPPAPRPVCSAPTDLLPRNDVGTPSEVASLTPHHSHPSDSPRAFPDLPHYRPNPFTAQPHVNNAGSQTQSRHPGASIFSSEETVEHTGARTGVREGVPGPSTPRSAGLSPGWDTRRLGGHRALSPPQVPLACVPPPAFRRVSSFMSLCAHTQVSWVVCGCPPSSVGLRGPSRCGGTWRSLPGLPTDWAQCQARNAGRSGLHPHAGCLHPLLSVTLRTLCLPSNSRRGRGLGSRPQHLR